MINIDYLNTKTLNIVDEINDRDSFVGDVVIEDGRIYYNGIEIIPKDEEDYIENTENEYDIFDRNTNMQSHKIQL